MTEEDETCWKEFMLIIRDEEVEDGGDAHVFKINTTLFHLSCLNSYLHHPPSLFQGPGHPPKSSSLTQADFLWQKIISGLRCPLWAQETTQITVIDLAEVGVVLKSASKTVPEGARTELDWFQMIRVRCLSINKFGSVSLLPVQKARDDGLRSTYFSWFFARQTSQQNHSPL